MINSKFNGKIFGSNLVLVLLMATFSFAQQSTKPMVVYKRESKPLPVAARNNVYCAGYIQTNPISTNFEIVGAKDENEQYTYASGEYVYVNQGSNNGVRVGSTYSVVRPRGQFKSKLSDKKGKLGFYVEEVGMIEIVRVNRDVSVARVKNACENFLLGDLLQPVVNRDVPVSQNRPALDIFAEPSGKSVGKIVLARDSRESLSRDQIVYIDLGAEDNVKVGDYLTAFRPVGKGGVLNYRQEEIMVNQQNEYGSQTYQGSPYSIMAPRKSGDTAEGKLVKNRDVKKRRPAELRKVVGEMIVLNVKEKTATALILRNAQEIHVGDYVEIQ